MYCLKPKKMFLHFLTLYHLGHRLACFRIAYPFSCLTTSYHDLVREKLKTQLLSALMFSTACYICYSVL